MVEMTFYLIFPALVFLIRGWVTAIIALLLSNFFANYLLQLLWINRASLWPTISDDLVSTFLNLWFPSQLPIFVIGFLLFFIIRDYKGILPLWSVRLLLVVSICSMIALALHQTPLQIFGQRISVYTSYGICFGIFAFSLSDGAAKWFVNTPIRYLGKVSFSAYLWHFAVLGILSKLSSMGIDPFDLKTSTHGFFFFCGFFPFLIIVTVSLSTITYRLVERPMIALGGRLVKKIDNRKRALVTI